MRARGRLLRRHFLDEAEPHCDSTLLSAILTPTAGDELSFGGFVRFIVDVHRNFGECLQNSAWPFETVPDA